MNRSKRTQLIIICSAFIIILAAYLGFRYYMNHLPEKEEEEADITVTAVDTSLITKIGVINGTDSFQLQKEEDTWKCLEDDTFSADADKLQAFLEAAGNITSELMIEDVTDMSQYGLEKPAVTISLQWDGGLYHIKIGDQNTVIGGDYYIRINEESTVYTIDSLLYDSLNKEKEDFELTEEE